MSMHQRLVSSLLTSERMFCLLHDYIEKQVFCDYRCTVGDARPRSEEQLRIEAIRVFDKELSKDASAHRVWDIRHVTIVYLKFTIVDRISSAVCAEASFWH